jgi:hypothetical protein
MSYFLLLGISNIIFFICMFHLFFGRMINFMLCHVNVLQKILV